MNVAIWPAVTVWLTGWVVIDGVTGIPAPLIEIDSWFVVINGVTTPLPLVTLGAASWVLVIMRLPEASPIAVGANRVVNVVLCPQAKVKGSDGPLTVKPPPEATALVIVILPIWEFVTVRV